MVVGGVGGSSSSSSRRAKSSRVFRGRLARPGRDAEIMHHRGLDVRVEEFGEIRDYTVVGSGKLVLLFILLVFPLLPLPLLELPVLLLLELGPALLVGAAQVLEPVLELLPPALVLLLILALLLAHDAALGAPAGLEAALFPVGDVAVQRPALVGVGGGDDRGAGVGHGAVGGRGELGPAAGDAPGVELDVGL